MRITSLMFVAATLTLAGCVPQQQYNQEVQQNQQLLYLNSTYQQLNQNLQSEVAANQVQVRQLQNRLEVTMVNSILFPEGGWESPPARPAATDQGLAGAPRPEWKADCHSRLHRQSADRTAAIRPIPDQLGSRGGSSRFGRSLLRGAGGRSKPVVGGVFREISSSCA
jgi:outer membrane murein-binding lipoprotein Lpp